MKRKRRRRREAKRGEGKHEAIIDPSVLWFSTARMQLLHIEVGGTRGSMGEIEVAGGRGFNKIQV